MGEIPCEEPRKEEHRKSRFAREVTITEFCVKIADYGASGMMQLSPGCQSLIKKLLKVGEN